MIPEEYKKMILALPEEFFKDWHWQAGDRAILRDDRYKREVLVINTHSQIMSSRTVQLLFPDSLDGCTTEEHVMRLRPVPSQDQLQKICMLSINCNACDLLRFFEAWLYEDEIRPVVRFADFNDLWLKYTMWVWGRKEWNGMAWI